VLFHKGKNKEKQTAMRGKQQCDAKRKTDYKEVKQEKTETEYLHEIIENSNKTKI